MNFRLPKLVAAALVFLLLVLLLAAFAYGVATVRYQLHLFPYIDRVEAGLNWTLGMAQGEKPWWYQPTTREQRIYVHGDGAPEDGLNLVTGMGPDSRLSLQVVDMQGATVHEWPVDWFDIWPDATHLPAESIPRTRPGTHLHGTWLLPDGDVLFNFEKQGMVRMGLCGEVRWRLPYQTHHSIFIDDDGNIWASGLKWNTEPLPDYPAHAVPVREQTIVKVAPDGTLLDEISVFDLLASNGQRALLNMRSSSISNTVSGDSLHLNDVEVFPETMEEGFFKHGDVVISLRNVSSILVFDQATWQLKLIQTGGFVRQHDPDFIDGNTLLIFDNNNIGPRSFGQQSRILKMTAPEKELSEVYSGSAGQPFYTHIMGKQQLLDNGHLLITDSYNGRGFEVDENGQIIWEYINLVDNGVVGIMEEIERIPESYRAIFAAADCDS